MVVMVVGVMVVMRVLLQTSEGLQGKRKILGSRYRPRRVAAPEGGGEGAAVHGW